MNVRFLFLNESDTSGESRTFYCEDGKRLTLQVSGESAVDVSVQVRNDIEGDFLDCACTKLSNGSTVERINSEGMYSVSLDGILQLRIKNNGEVGSVKVFGVMTD